MHPTTTIINCLREHGQLLDVEISRETGLSLSTVRRSVSDLSDRGEISSCSVTRYENGKPIHGALCRISGYTPPLSSPRKTAAKGRN